MGYDLATVDEFKTYRGINKSDEDTKISQLLVAATDLVKTYCNRTFIDYFDTNKVEYFDGTKYQELFLEEIPLISVIDVEYSLDGTTYTSFVEGTDYFVNDTEDSIVSAYGYEFLKGETVLFPKKSIRVTFKGGYEEAPADVKQAVLDIVEYYRNQQFTPRKMSANMTLENIGFRAGSSIGLPPHIKRILEMYRVQ